MSLDHSPRAFVSHSHSDKAVAERLATELRKKGVDAWLDKWEIQPGDSIVQKIFEEGLKDCAAFLILLSQSSVESRWVKQELDAALVQRIEGTTRVIPVLTEACAVPLALRATLWVDLAPGIDSAVERIADVVFGRSVRPAIGRPPGPRRVERVEGLSDYAAAIGAALAPALLDGSGIRGSSGPALSESLNLSPVQVNDAVEELESMGLVRIHRYLGTSPFNFGIVEPTYALALQFKGTSVIEYDPEEDILMVASAVAAAGHIHGPGIVARTNLTPARVNHAISYLGDYAYVKLIRALGTAPFNFMQAEATGATRRFVAEHAR